MIKLIPRPDSFLDENDHVKVAANTATVEEKAVAGVVLCDGVDDHLTIQAAIETLSTNDTLELSTGLFNLDDTSITGWSAINLVSNMTLKGQGMNQTKLKIGNGVQLNAIGCIEKTNITLEGFEVDGNYDNVTAKHPDGDERQNGLYFAESTHLTLQNINTHHNIFHGFFFYNGCTDNLVTDCAMAYNGYRAVHAHDYCHRNTYQRNTVYNNAYYPEGTAGGGMFVVYNECNDNVIRENIIMDDRQCGLDITGSLEGFEPCTGNQYLDNTIITGRVGSYGISIVLDTLEDTLIDGNTIQTYDTGIMCVTGNPDSLTITNNTITSLSSYAIRLLGDNHVVTDNVLYSKGSSNPVLSLQTGNNYLAQDNIILMDNSIGGIQLRSVNNSIVTGNTVSPNCSYCVAEKTGYGGTGNVITPNTCS